MADLRTRLGSGAIENVSVIELDRRPAGIEEPMPSVAPSAEPTRPRTPRATLSPLEGLKGERTVRDGKVRAAA